VILSLVSYDIHFHLVLYSALDAVTFHVSHDALLSLCIMEIAK